MWIWETQRQKSGHLTSLIIETGLCPDLFLVKSTHETLSIPQFVNKNNHRITFVTGNTLLDTPGRLDIKPYHLNPYLYPVSRPEVVPTLVPVKSVFRPCNLSRPSTSNVKTRV